MSSMDSPMTLGGPISIVNRASLRPLVSSQQWNSAISGRGLFISQQVASSSIRFWEGMFPNRIESRLYN